MARIRLCRPSPHTSSALVQLHHRRRTAQPALPNGTLVGALPLALDCPFLLSRLGSPPDYVNPRILNVALEEKFQEPGP